MSQIKDSFSYKIKIMLEVYYPDTVVKINCCHSVAVSIES